MRRQQQYDALVELARREVARVRQQFREEYQNLSAAERVELMRAMDNVYPAPACPPPKGPQ